LSKQASVIPRDDDGDRHVGGALLAAHDRQGDFGPGGKVVAEFGLLRFVTGFGAGRLSCQPFEGDA